MWDRIQSHRLRIYHVCRTPLISQVTHASQDTITQVKNLSCVSHTTHITSNANGPGYNHTCNGFIMCVTAFISQVTHVSQNTFTQVKNLSCVSHTTHITSNACEPGYNHTGKKFIMCVAHHSYHK